MSKGRVKLRAGRDVFVNESKPNGNFRGSKRLRLNGGGGSNDRQAFIYFPVRLPRKATITSATLRLVMEDDTQGDGSRTVTLNRISENWKQGKVTWSNKPGVTGGGVAVTKNGKPKNEVWEFDVKAHMQLVANGTKWYGWRINLDENKLRSFFSSESNRKPTLEIEWTEDPYAPTDLNPTGGGFVAVPAPVLSWDFRDNRGTTSMGGYQVQLSTDSSFGTILHNTGTVTANDPVHDLGADAGWSDLTDDTPIYWRVKVKDDANNWSPWSDTASFAYEAMGTLSISGGNTISDISPTVTWSLSKTQSQWQVVVRDANGVELYDSGKYASTDQSWQVPAKVRGKRIIRKKSATYSIVVRAWDDTNRASTVGGDIRYEAVKEVTYQPGSTLTAPSNLVVNEIALEPGVELTWNRTESPDRFGIWRDGELLDSVEPGDVVHGTGYRYVDYTGEVGTTYTYSVTASVNGDSAESTQVTGKRSKAHTGLWLIDPLRDIRVQLLGNDSGDWSMGEVSTTYTPIGATSSRVVTQALRGYEGSISGILAGSETKSIKQQEEDMFELKATPGETYILVASDLAIPVCIANVTVAPTPHKETIREVEFDFYQQGLPFRQTL